jgi:ADP-heptose:LPS heptosyltransferase
MTESIAKFLSQYVDNIYLATEIKNAEDVLSTYKEVFDYKDVNSDKIKADIKIKLVYELADNRKSYIQGYMESVGFGEVKNSDIPEINSNWKDIIDEKYILLAPHTSPWEEKKRNWGYQNYLDLKALLDDEFEVRCIILEDNYSFQEMMSLIKNCMFFVGNDSGPAVIAQSFDKDSFVVFGGTSPKYLHLSKNTTAIYDQDRHKLCNHNFRQEEIDCCEEFCMERIRVKDVFSIIKKKHDRTK